MNSLQGKPSSSHPKERNVSLSSLRPKIPLLIIVVILGSVLVAIPAYFYFQSLKSEVQSEQEASHLMPTGTPTYDFESSTLTLDRIAKCANGIFPEHPSVLSRSKDNNWPYGLVFEKDNTDNPILKVENIYDGSRVDVDLGEIDKFYYREIFDRQGYKQGKRVSFGQKSFSIGEPFTVDDLYDSVAIGSHVWVPYAQVNGLGLFIYCDK